MGGASYGTEFTHEEINEALTLEDPFSLVPSKDTDGHGTFLAGLAAGTAFPLQNFTGAAPMADLAIVKLKPAKKYLGLLSDFRRYPAFQENDIMMGIKYLRVIADRFRRPLSHPFGTWNQLRQPYRYLPGQVTQRIMAAFSGSPQ